MRRVAFAVTSAASLLVATSAAAGPFFDASTPKVASPGEVVTLHAGMGEKVQGSLPVYLIRSQLAPRPYRCGAGYCEPVSRGAPTATEYTRIGAVNVAHTRGSPASGYAVTIRYRVPRSLKPGRYAYVLYCGVCARGRAGSLVAWPTERIAGTPQTIPIGAALIVR